MDDLISRQAAIEALGERPMVWVGSDYELGARNQYDADVLALETVPSAQPEQRWIPCSERLPDDDRTKVVTLANGNAEAGYYSNGDWWCIGDTISLENPIVIAWMPLPEPYREERTEE